ncbi:hypothetical protein ACLOJK_008890 [Asimina triloba]
MHHWSTNIRDGSHGCHPAGVSSNDKGRQRGRRCVRCGGDRLRRRQIDSSDRAGFLPPRSRSGNPKKKPIKIQRACVIGGFIFPASDGQRHATTAAGKIHRHGQAAAAGAGGQLTTSFQWQRATMMADEQGSDGQPRRRRRASPSPPSRRWQCPPQATGGRTTRRAASKPIISPPNPFGQQGNHPWPIIIKLDLGS